MSAAEHAPVEESWRPDWEFVPGRKSDHRCWRDGLATTCADRPSRDAALYTAAAAAAAAARAQRADGRPEVETVTSRISNYTTPEAVTACDQRPDVSRMSTPHFHADQLALRPSSRRLVMHQLSAFVLSLELLCVVFTRTHALLVTVITSRRSAHQQPRLIVAQYDMQISRRTTAPYCRSERTSRDVYY